METMNITEMSRDELIQLIADRQDTLDVDILKQALDRIDTLENAKKSEADQAIAAINDECMKRIQAVHDFRASSKRAATAKAADKPTRFMTENMPKSNYIVVPKVSSERRRYIPMGFFTPDIICSDLVFLIPDAILYHFGVLESNVHMSWMRAVCGRLKSDYRYSKDIVYNNFPWPDHSPEQKEKIEKTAQGILDARALYPDSSLADLYDPLTMPPELRKAHQKNDAAAMQAYGMPIKDTDEAACVAWLMKLYQEKVNNME